MFICSFAQQYRTDKPETKEIDRSTRGGSGKVRKKRNGLH
jgi:hypothetical protein